MPIVVLMRLVGNGVGGEVLIDTGERRWRCPDRAIDSGATALAPVEGPRAAADVQMRPVAWTMAAAARRQKPGCVSVAGCNPPLPYRCRSRPALSCGFRLEARILFVRGFDQLISEGGVVFGIGEVVHRQVERTQSLVAWTENHDIPILHLP
jgi:hypothetical protein